MKLNMSLSLRSIAVSALLAAPMAPAAEACQCLPRDAKTRFEQAGSVFQATVISAKPSQKGNITLRVNRVWKGNVAIDTVEAKEGETNCNVGFKPGQEYLLFAKPWDGVLQPNMCDVLTAEEAKAAVKELNKNYPSAEPMRSQDQPVIKDKKGPTSR